MDRRDFLAVGGRTVTLALGAGIGPEQVAALGQPYAASDELEQRVAAILQAYDAQGNHRTGTDVDARSAEWLAGHVRRLGVRPSLESFSLSRGHPLARGGRSGVDGPLRSGSGERRPGVGAGAREVTRRCSSW